MPLRRISGSPIEGHHHLWGPQGFSTAVAAASMTCRSITVIPDIFGADTYMHLLGDRVDTTQTHRNYSHCILC